MFFSASLLSLVLLEEMLRWLRDHLLTGDAGLFLQENTVRPGILVMINDTDWDLMVSGDEKQQRKAISS